LYAAKGYDALYAAEWSGGRSCKGPTPQVDLKSFHPVVHMRVLENLCFLRVRDRLVLVHPGQWHSMVQNKTKNKKTKNKKTKNKKTKN